MIVDRLRDLLQLHEKSGCEEFLVVCVRERNSAGFMQREGEQTIQGWRTTQHTVREFRFYTNARVW